MGRHGGGQDPPNGGGIFWLAVTLVLIAIFLWIFNEISKIG